MMAMADNATYTVLLAMIGPVALAVTTSLNINFLRKPAPGDLIAEATLLKLGRRLAVGEVTLSSDDVTGPVAHSTVTYSMLSRRHQPVERTCLNEVVVLGVAEVGVATDNPSEASSL